MLSADGHLTHHLPTPFPMSIPVRKYVDVIAGSVPPSESHRVHQMVREVSNPEELVDVALVTPDPIPTRWRKLHCVTQYPRLPNQFRQLKRSVSAGFYYHSNLIVCRFGMEIINHAIYLNADGSVR